jgi:Mesyanzhinovviridae bifunctional DNA primase/polymerase
MTGVVTKAPPGYSLKTATERKPQFGWNCKADIERAKEYLEKVRKTDAEAEHIDAHIGYLRMLGIHPERAIRLLMAAYPIYANDKAYNADTRRRILITYSDAADPPGLDASGNDAREQASDGEWDERYSKTKLKVLKEWQWITDSMQFVNNDGLQTMNDKQFERSFGKLTTKNLMTQINRGEVPMKKFAAQVFIPNAPPILRYTGEPKMHYTGRAVFNFWRPSGMKPVDKPADAKWFLDHIEKLFPDDWKSQQLLLDYMAQLVQRPEVKIHFAALLVSADGAGKGALGRILRSILGDRNVVEPDSSEFIEQYTGWQEGAQLAVVAEVWVNGNRDTMDFLKRMITEDTLRIHKKFGNRFSIPNHLNFFCMTNHKDAVPLTKFDRRWMVLSSPFVPSPSDESYFDQLWANINSDSKIAAAMGYLMRHEITLNPKGHAPVTAAKVEMLERAQSDMAADLKSRLEAQEPPFDRDVIRIDDIVGLLKEGKPYTRNAHKEAREFLDRIGARALRRYTHGDVPAYRLYAIRNHDKWEKTPPRTVARDYHRFHTGDTDAEDFG